MSKSIKIKMAFAILALVGLGTLIILAIMLIKLNNDKNRTFIPIEIYPIPEITEESSDVILASDIFDELYTKTDKDWIICYNELQVEYPDLQLQDIYDAYSEEDIEYLMRAVETECYGGDFESKANVASVIINRVNNKRFPSTIYEVVTSPNQFAYSRTEISEDTRLACEYAYLQDTPVSDCLWFHSMAYSESFSGGTYVLTDSVGHHFYKET